MYAVRYIQKFQSRTRYGDQKLLIRLKYRRLDFVN